MEQLQRWKSLLCEDFLCWNSAKRRLFGHWPWSNLRWPWKVDVEINIMHTIYKHMIIWCVFSGICAVTYRQSNFWCACRHLLRAKSHHGTTLIFCSFENLVDTSISSLYWETGLTAKEKGENILSNAGCQLVMLCRHAWIVILPEQQNQEFWGARPYCIGFVLITIF